ncbi:MAG: hypothetical protein LBH19_05855 [Dysgonamonadaceae bacterium]|nr:hypothetical protein [Dysgonamonadaceae bacterium]
MSASVALTLQDCIDYIFNLTINRTFDGFIREKSVVNEGLAKIFPEITFEESDSELDPARPQCYGNGNIYDKCRRQESQSDSVQGVCKGQSTRIDAPIGRLCIAMVLGAKVRGSRVVPCIRPDLYLLSPDLLYLCPAATVTSVKNVVKICKN